MRFLIATAFVAVLVVPAAAQEPVRLDPALRPLLRADVRAALAQAAARPAVEGALAIDAVPGEEPRVGVLVRLDGPNGVAALRAAGAEVGSVIGDIATARIPLAALPSIAALPGIESVQAARVITTTHDSSMKAIGLHTVRSRQGDVWTGATGQGVLVGIYDTGVDLLHDDFVDRFGTTRIAAAWDQTQTLAHLPPPAPFTYGILCDQGAIQRRIVTGNPNECPLRDFQAHGTHVAGTAAGDGSAPGGTAGQFRFAGVAPNAELLVVKGGAGTFDEGRLVDGLAWLKAVGESRRQPVVVNLSLGGQFGPRDGTRLSEQAIDALAGPGFIIVFSAGNAGSNRNTQPQVVERLTHARAAVAAMQSIAFAFEISPYTPAIGECVPGLGSPNSTRLEMWYQAEDRLRVEVVRPDGSTVAGAYGTTGAADGPQGHVQIDNAIDGPNAANGDHQAAIVLSDCGASSTAPASGPWQVRVVPEVSGSGGPVDLWLVGGGLGLNGQTFGRQGFDNRFVLGTPGTATRAITVSAFVTKECWDAQVGPVCYAEREDVGDIAFFSSAGPRRDGYQKPEIAAPGKGVASALSSAVSANLQRVTPDGTHVILEGTSMAAPHVTGVVALLLEAEPTLTPERARDILTGTARQDGFTSRIYGTSPGGASPQDWWGAGKLEACAAVFALREAQAPILVLSAEASPAQQSVLGVRGTQVPLLAMSFESTCLEPVAVRSLTVTVDGDDPDARLLLLRDIDGDGVAEDRNAILAQAPVGATGSVDVVLEPEDITVTAGTPVHVVAILELSGAAPNGATFSASFDPATLVATGTRTGQDRVLDGHTTVVATGTTTTTLLRGGQDVTLSENPVRSGSLLLTFSEPPDRVLVYTVTGRRVADLGSRLTGDRESLDWDLTNDEGAPIVPGVYLLIIDVGNERLREKLIIARPATEHP